MPALDQIAFAELLRSGTFEAGLAALAARLW